MTTVQHLVAAPLSPMIHHEETQALDNYMLATRVVHRAETLLGRRGRGSPTRSRTSRPPSRSHSR